MAAFKVNRVFENDDWIIDILETENGPMLRVSVFDEDGHFLDEEFIKKADYFD